MTDELWKIIDGYPNYMVSNQGGVLNCKRNRKLSPSLNKDGYPVVCLTFNGVSSKLEVHRLEALAFILNPENKPEVNHIDEDKANNFDWNLEWVTGKENKQHSAHQVSKWWYFIDPDGKEISIFNLAKFCREEGLSKTSMMRVASGKTDQCKGWKLNINNKEVQRGWK